MESAATADSAVLDSHTRSAYAAMALTFAKSCVETRLRTFDGSRSNQAVWNRIPGGSPLGRRASIRDISTEGRASPNGGWCRMRLAMAQRDGA